MISSLLFKVNEKLNFMSFVYWIKRNATVDEFMAVLDLPDGKMWLPMSLWQSWAFQIERNTTADELGTVVTTYIKRNISVNNISFNLCRIYDICLILVALFGIYGIGLHTRRSKEGLNLKDNKKHLRNAKL